MKADRRERLALDEAYRLFQHSLESDETIDLFRLARALKTVTSAINGATNGEFKLTVRLWHRIYQGLFENLITGYASHVVLRDADGTVLPARASLPDEGTVTLYPQGLKRDDDCFVLALDQLDWGTKEQLEKAWLDHGPNLRKEDFNATSMHCTDQVCMPKKFVVGKEILQAESAQGKQVAYEQWWDLFWQTYCSTNEHERQSMVKRMTHLESVWGNLYY